MGQRHNCTGAIRPERWRTGVISTTSFHNGFDLDLAYISQMAFPTAPVAMWMTPFSGPILAIDDGLLSIPRWEAEKIAILYQRSCESAVRCVHVLPISAKRTSIFLPTIRSATLRIAWQTYLRIISGLSRPMDESEHTISLPRPIVNVIPTPLRSGEDVLRITYADE